MDEITEEDEYLLDEVAGVRRKNALALLSKKKISKLEMDELFANMNA